MNLMPLFPKLYDLSLYHSKATKMALTIGFIVVFLIEAFMPEYLLKKDIILLIGFIVGILIVYDILWRNLQKKYIIQKCPRYSCNNIIKIKIKDDENTKYKCDKCKLEFIKSKRKIKVIY